MLLVTSSCCGQGGYVISGIIVDQASGKPVPYASISLPPNGTNLLSNIDGAFKFIASYLNNRYAIKGAIYLGITLSF